MGTETPAVCSHGSLRRSCEICERDMPPDVREAAQRWKLGTTMEELWRSAFIAGWREHERYRADRSPSPTEGDAEIERLRAERDEAIAAARHLKNLVTSPLTEEDKEWARETMSDTNLARMPRDLATILRTEARNQRTPPIDYAVAEDGGRMVARPEPDIAMAELLEEAAARIAELEAALDRIANVVGEDEPSIMWPWAQEIARSVLKESGS